MEAGNINRGTGRGLKLAYLKQEKLVTSLSRLFHKKSRNELAGHAPVGEAALTAPDGIRLLRTAIPLMLSLTSRGPVSLLGTPHTPSPSSGPLWPPAECAWPASCNWDPPTGPLFSDHTLETPCPQSVGSCPRRQDPAVMVSAWAQRGRGADPELPSGSGGHRCPAAAGGRH